MTATVPAKPVVDLRQARLARWIQLIPHGKARDWRISELLDDQTVIREDLLAAREPRPASGPAMARERGSR